MKYDVIHLKDIYPVLDKNGADPTLEILVPNVVGKLKKRPSMLVCPGGGYEFTWEGEGENVAFEYLTLGFNAFVLRYSVKPHTFPQQILEVACAFDYIINNAEEFNGDPDKNAILGFSAGGHLAASYCTLRNLPEITSVIPEPKAIQAAVLCYPVISADMPTHKGSFKALTGKDELTKEELDMLPIGAIMMTFECGMRFLTDYLEGDHYFKIHRENHNLDRARNQFALVRDIEKKLPDMAKIVEKYIK